GVHNAAAMLVDSRTMAVQALVGSANFFNKDIAGQVNGTAAKRSPGSTLKPFIYALALDQGVLHPMTVLKDAPSAFGAYSPENFDGRFVGPLTAKDALIRSRNVPAVYVASHLSKPDLYDFLQMAGVSGLRSREYYGLALVLGGGSLTMEELVALYGALANHGVVRPVRYRADQRMPAGVRVLSAEASYVTLDMLKDNPRPGDLSAATPGPLSVYWKTGTSYGFHDAWAIGIFGPYILAVWVGNFDGAGNPAFVGVQMAAPLFFQVVDAIEAQEPSLAEPVRRAARASCGLRNVGLRHAQAVPAGGSASPDSAALRRHVRNVSRRISGRSPAADHLPAAGRGVFAARQTTRPGDHHPASDHRRRRAGGLLVRRRELRRQGTVWRKPRLEDGSAGLIHGAGRG